MVENPPSNTKDTSLILVGELDTTCHRGAKPTNDSKWACTLQSSCSAVKGNPTATTREAPIPHVATRKRMSAAMKTQYSKNKNLNTYSFIIFKMVYDTLKWMLLTVMTYTPHLKDILQFTLYYNNDYLFLKWKIYIYL